MSNLWCSTKAFPDDIFCNLLPCPLQVSVHPLPVQSHHTEEYCRNRGLIGVSASITVSFIPFMKTPIDSKPGYVGGGGNVSRPLCQIKCYYAFFFPSTHFYNSSDVLCVLTFRLSTTWYSLLWYVNLQKEGWIFL